MQLGHAKHIRDANSSCFASHFNSHDNRPHSNGYSYAILIQIHIVWRKYLVGVKCHPMQNHVLCGSQNHDSFANAPVTHSVPCCKCNFVLVLCILGFLPLFVFLFCIKIVPYGLVCFNRSMSLRFAAKMDGLLYFVLTLLLRFCIGASSPCPLTFRSSNVLSRILSSNPLSTLFSRRCSNTCTTLANFRACHNNDLFPLRYLQICKLIRKRFDLIDVVQQIVLLLHLAR